jgi:rhodanese-related sulfurtransferase
MAEGDEIRVGEMVVSAMATPGHTPEHLAWVVHEGSAGPRVAVFTGGSLMVGSAGRTDLLGPAETASLTRRQFDSLAGLAALPDEVRVLPTHGSGSFCGSTAGGTRRTSTMGAERASNPALAHTDVATFVHDRLSGLLEYPAYYGSMAPLNRAGPSLIADLEPPRSLDPAQVERAVAQGARLVDGRDRAAFAAAHIRGSTNVELDEQFATYVGWVLPWNSPIVLVLPDPELEARTEALTQLRGIGFDRVIGHAAGGVEAWHESGRETQAYPTASIDDLCAAVSGDPGKTPAVLDVRQPPEWADGMIPGSRTIFVGDLPERLAEVPSDREVWVTCKTGHRAAIAGSILDGSGIGVRLVTPGGVPDWLLRCGGSAAGGSR